MEPNRSEKKSRFIKAKKSRPVDQSATRPKAEQSSVSSNAETTRYLDAILQLQCDTREELNGLLGKMEQLQPKAQETYARINGIQSEVEDLSESLGKFVRQEKQEPAPAPKENHLLRYIGTSALMAPLIWNGISAGVSALWEETGVLSASGACLMSAVISAAWGLLLLCVEPWLNRMLKQRTGDQLCEALEDDWGMEAYLRDLKEGGAKRGSDDSR